MKNRIQPVDYLQIVSEWDSEMNRKPEKQIRAPETPAFNGDVVDYLEVVKGYDRRQPGRQDMPFLTRDQDPVYNAIN